MRSFMSRNDDDMLVRWIAKCLNSTNKNSSFFFVCNLAKLMQRQSKNMRKIRNLMYK